MSLETCPKKPLSFLICESKDNHILERHIMVVSSPCCHCEPNLDDPLEVKCFCFPLISVAVAILVQGHMTVATIMNLELSEANDCR